jgi:hypothetical protein
MTEIAREMRRDKIEILALYRKQYGQERER